MARYESHFYQGDLNMVVTVRGGGLDHSFQIREDNKLLSQLASLPSVPATLNLSVRGQGCALLQVS